MLPGGRGREAGGGPSLSQGCWPGVPGKPVLLVGLSLRCPGSLAMCHVPCPPCNRTVLWVGGDEPASRRLGRPPSAERPLVVTVLSSYAALRLGHASPVTDLTCYVINHRCGQRSVILLLLPAAREEASSPEGRRRPVMAAVAVGSAGCAPRHSAPLHPLPVPGFGLSQSCAVNTAAPPTQGAGSRVSTVPRARGPPRSAPPCSDSCKCPRGQGGDSGRPELPRQEYSSSECACARGPVCFLKQL